MRNTLTVAPQSQSHTLVIASGMLTPKFFLERLNIPGMAVMKMLVPIDRTASGKKLGKGFQSHLGSYIDIAPVERILFVDHHLTKATKAFVESCSDELAIPFEVFSLDNVSESAYLQAYHKLLLSCIDPRCTLLREEELRKRFPSCHISIPGSCKELMGEDKHARHYLIENIKCGLAQTGVGHQITSKHQLCRKFGDSFPSVYDERQARKAFAIDCLRSLAGEVPEIRGVSHSFAFEELPKDGEKGHFLSEDITHAIRHGNTEAIAA